MNEKKSFVALTYDLYVGEENEKELMEQATEEQPLTFYTGLGMMLDKFEAEIAPLKVGDSFDFVIPVDDAYGEYEDEKIIELPKNIFEVDGAIDEEMIAEGNMVPLVDSEGNRINASIVSVGEDIVTVDINHPLAGEDLHFIGKVIEMREATEEELKAVFSSGCGCGSGGCDSGDCGSGGCGCSSGECDSDDMYGCNCGCN
ncbi:MAG: peptidylprolyl isomerase [Bacteroidales bacterium]|jgi:FKBP-type peptidyl-prolyl cis-trans isomerase SlyD|nr:peptidylprolyl isomerase [Bacteroidales bacterium]HOR41236.1 FKBP-type peptidyl-prolyl cis-trans isomerase [Paludibacteraceae bacterium]HPL94581.1 FKBP-type peptidyl-prolyl cis-trans isomerase [Paludibacteraceae bacterium]